ncbi:MAG: TIGR03546 family protein [Ignavibacteriae bacterium]|nr:TIGR03546 family protein [Ignavibacteriota bacterium]
MFWLQIVANFLKILRAGQTPQQIAGGFALGSILGLSPMFTLQGLAVWLLILILNVNLSAAILSLTLFSLVAFIFDPVFHWLGYEVLVNVDELTGTWTALYNAPIAPLTRFNNTVVMGSFLSSLVLFVPVYFGMKQFVVAYRSTLGARIEKWKIYQIISKNFIVRWYNRIKNFGSS